MDIYKREANSADSLRQHVLHAFPTKIFGLENNFWIYLAVMISQK